MLIKIFVRTFPSSEDCELFESILETRWPNLLQEVKGVRFRAMKNPQTPNVSVVLWEFPDNEAMKKIEKLIGENIAKYVKHLPLKLSISLVLLHKILVKLLFKSLLLLQ